jgi:hypothetical protein
MTRREQATTMRFYNKRLLVSTLLFSLLYAGPAQADVEDLELSDGEAVAQEAALDPQRHAAIFSGYRFITPDGPTAAASPYGRHSSGASGGFSAGTLGSDLKLTIDGMFLHEDDYHTELFFDYRGLVRLHAESSALWHNLLREELPPEVGSATLLIDPRDKGTDYGVRVSTSQADTRIKLGNNPYHLNLGYWELRREGNEQLRFTDHFWAGDSSINSKSKPVDSVTREGSIGFDAHLKLVNLFYEFRIRDFSNDAADPRHSFANDADGALVPGSQAHNTTPDSRVSSHTIKLFTDLSGGLVGTASYNLTQRENKGRHGEAIPSTRPEDTIHSLAGDLIYTPTKRHFFALKYRHREIERSTPASLIYPYSQIPASPPGVYTTVPGKLLVKPSPSSIRDTLTFSATFRPAPKVIYRLEYNAELESRTNIRDAQTSAGSPTEIHPDSRQTHTGTAVFYWKPVTGVKVNSSYSYATSDNPAYGTSFSDRHTGKLLVTYAASGTWGVAANYLVRYDSGKQSAFTVDQNFAPVASHEMPRKQHSDSCNTSVWFTPAERLTITASYSYLETETDQSILFDSLITGSAPLTVGNYRSSSHIYGIDAAYNVSEPLDVSLAFQQVRSQARFDAADRNFTLDGVTGTFNTTGIGELSKLDSTETGVSARVDWRVTPFLGCSLDYSFRMYESGQPLYNGAVHSTMATIKARW